MDKDKGKPLRLIIEELAKLNIKVQLSVKKHHNLVVFQYNARIGDALVPVGHASGRLVGDHIHE